MTNLMHTCFILQYVCYNPLHVFEHYMLIIRRMNCIDAASGIVTLSEWPPGAQVESGGVAACHSVACVLCAVQSTIGHCLSTLRSL